MPRPRILLRPWPQLRSYSTSRTPDPSLLQRELFRRVAQPVAVLTAHIPSPSSSPDASPTFSTPSDSRRPHNHGATLSSLTSISISPPLVSFSLRLPSRLATYLSNFTSSRDPSFRVYLLSPEQEDLARLFARQSPLPAPAVPSAETNWTVEPTFDETVFRKLVRDEVGLLGSLDCTILEKVNLWELDRQDEEKGETHEGKGTSKSQLFIARVEKVRLGEKAKGKGSLVWIEQKYRAVEP
ncbi:uncharacterized protein JCM6883_001472 [Sporobolomyces salmoneus]|uniref:uncharacterized protein n=1 Tax=Sporobolomyces salmoneus TaxID=183962 RepID=UPI00316B5D39